mgnify:CR=1 FL=1
MAFMRSGVRSPSTPPSLGKKRLSEKAVSFFERQVEVAAQFELSRIAIKVVFRMYEQNQSMWGPGYEDLVPGNQQVRPA